MMTLTCPECESDTWHLQMDASHHKRVECTECGNQEDL